MKKLFFLILALLPLSTHATETLQAGFAAPPRIIPESLELGKPARIYTSLFNQTNFDINGSLYFYYNDKLIDDIVVTLPAQSNVRYWSDTTIASGTQRFSAELRNMKKNELGKIPESILITTSSLRTEKEISKTPLSFLSTTTSPASIITVSSATTADSNSANESPPLSSVSSSFLSSSLKQKAASTTKNVVQIITRPLIRLLDEKQNSLENAIKTNSSSQPIPALDHAVSELEKKSTFFKIPREKLPTTQHLYIWLIKVAKYVLNTWWVMLIVFLALLRTSWKLWRRIQRDEEY